jgi:hypothetical protein
LRHLRVATYEISPGTTFQQVADVAKEGMLRTFREQPGFIRYGVADVGNNTCLSISLWETHKQADAAAPVAAAWVRENLGDRIMLKSNFVGDLAFYKGLPKETPATV